MKNSVFLCPLHRQIWGAVHVVGSQAHLLSKQEDESWDEIHPFMWFSYCPGCSWTSYSSEFRDPVYPWLQERSFITSQTMWGHLKKCKAYITESRLCHRYTCTPSHLGAGEKLLWSDDKNEEDSNNSWSIIDPTRTIPPTWRTKYSMIWTSVMLSRLMDFHIFILRNTPRG